MSQHNEKNPHQHQSPLHDSSEAKPGMDSLAPEDGSHRPAAEPTPPGAQPTAPGSLKAPDTRNEKLNSLEDVRKGSENYALTTNQGVRIADDQNSLRAGSRGPTLLEDFILREKITHFDHERIPERIVHARGSAAHGYFQPYKSLSDITKADFLSDPNKITPVFVRFSTVQGGAGSADTVRDIRGFATKFYTEEGIFDLVGNNTPIFFIQDAHKFPDFVHAVKPEPHWAIPQGQSAHDTFWDYVSLQPETLHNVMWAMSDRGIPRSYRTMEGFGIHTFRLINAEGKATFVRFHWKPLAGKASLVWDEAQKLTGRDPDFHRRELWEAIEAGDFPEYELGFQLIPEEDEFKFDFDLLDPTKLIPEELVPVQRVGKMVLNRNPDNFFAENEQAAFHPGHIVPGLDFTNDPLLQGRLFSYTDTQISRLGGPNFHEIPINRPTCPYHNFQRDGMHRMGIDTNPANYEPNSINDNWPRETPPGPKRGGFESYQERVEGNKVRERSPSFGNHGSGSGWGVFCMLFATVVFTLSGPWNKSVTKKADSFAVCFLNLFVGGAALFVLGTALGGRLGSVTPLGILVLLYLAFICGAGYLLWALLMKNNPVSRIAIFGFVNPVVNVLLSAVLNGEPLFRWQYLAALVFVCVGIWLVNKAPAKKEEQ